MFWCVYQVISGHRHFLKKRQQKNWFINQNNGTGTAWKKLTRFDTHHCNSCWKVPLCIEILYHINGSVQDWGISIANTLEILKSCFKQSIHSQYIAVRCNTILYRNTKGGSYNFVQITKSLIRSSLEKRQQYQECTVHQKRILKFKQKLN